MSVRYQTSPDPQMPQALLKHENVAEAAAFFILAFFLAICVALLGPWFGEATPLVTMFTPLMAVIIVKIAVPQGGLPTQLQQLGLSRTGWRQWPLAILLPLAALLPGYVFLWLSGWAGLNAVFEANAIPRETFRLAISILIGTALGAIGEEVGWRGYLFERLSVLGFWKASLLTGFLHGLWHMPLLLLTPLYHQTGNIIIFVSLFMVALTLSGPVYSWLRVISASVIPVAMMHRALNVYWDRFETMTAAADADTIQFVAGECGLLTIAMLIVLNLLLYRRGRLRQRDGME